MYVRSYVYGFNTLASPIRVNWCCGGGFPIDIRLIQDCMVGQNVCNLRCVAVLCASDDNSLLDLYSCSEKAGLHDRNHE